MYECEVKVINEWNGRIIGRVLKSLKKISFLGDIDPKTGLVLAKDSDIKGTSIKNKILIFPGGRGSTVGAGVLYGLSKNKTAPLMLITVVPDQVVISGAIFGDIPMASNLPLECFQKINSGDKIEVILKDRKEAIIRKIE